MNTHTNTEYRIFVGFIVSVALVQLLSCDGRTTTGSQTGQVPELDARSMVHSDISDDTSEVGTSVEELLRNDFEAGFETIKERIRLADTSQQKSALYRELFDFLRTPDGYNPYARAQVTDSLITDYVRRNEQGGLGEPRFSFSSVYFQSLSLYDVEISEDTRTELSSILRRPGYTPNAIEILLLGIYEIDGYETAVESTLAGIDVDGLIQERLQRGDYGRLGSEVFSALLVKAMHGDQVARESLLSYYESMHPAGRGAEFHWLRLVHQPDILRYLLSYAFSDEIAEGRPGYYIAQPAIDALASMHSAYPPPNFRAAANYDPQEAIALGRQWVQDNIDPSFLE